jgi:hypothetical protein
VSLAYNGYITARKLLCPQTHSGLWHGALVPRVPDHLAKGVELLAVELGLLGLPAGGDRRRRRVSRASRTTLQGVILGSRSPWQSLLSPSPMETTTARSSGEM